MRALIISCDCNPEWPSLPSFAYKYAMEVANRAEVVVATQIRNAKALSKAGLGRARVVYINSERIEGPLYRLAVRLRRSETKGWSIQMLFNYIGYLAFERYVWKAFRDDIQSGRFDVIHRLTPVWASTPSYIVGRTRVPFVIGPVSGGLEWPPGLRQTKHREMDRLDRLATFILKARNIFPYYRSTYTRSSAVLASFKHTFDFVPKCVSAKTINFPEIGIDPYLFQLPLRAKRTQSTVLFVGRLVPLKMPEVLLEAFRRSPLLRNHRLRFVGDGPERINLERLTKKYGLNDCVEYTGQKPLDEVAQIMRDSDIFAFPSALELTGGAVVEAMACGLACVVADHGGPATLIDETRGVKIKAGSVDQMRRDFQSALEALVSDPARIRKLGDAAHCHARKFYTWEAKARKTMDVYRWVTGETTQKPDYWDPSADTGTRDMR